MRIYPLLANSFITAAPGVREYNASKKVHGKFRILSLDSKYL